MIMLQVAPKLCLTFDNITQLIVIICCLHKPIITNHWLLKFQTIPITSIFKLFFVICGLYYLLVHIYLFNCLGW